MSRVYLDWNATAPLCAEARAAMLSAMETLGNPSSVHAEGRAAKALVEKARAQVAAAVGCTHSEVVFTSGATEAAHVLAGLAGSYEVRVDPTAHDALWAQMQDSAVERPAGGTAQILAMGLANSETGILTPPPDPVDGRWPHGAGLADLLMLDVTQAVGRIPWSFAWSGAQMAILSAHKLGGPKGAGALIVREGFDIGALSRGGGQEMGRRSGTENIVGIAGFGAAAEAAQQDLEAGAWARVEKLRNILEQALASAAPETIFVGKGVSDAGTQIARLPNTSCFITPGWKGETQVMQMDLAGYAISAGSACSSGKVKESRVLRALGYDPAEASSAVRVSLGPATTDDDVMGFARTWADAYRRWRNRAA